MRTMVIAGNWKMNTTTSEAAALASAIAEAPRHERVQLALCPPFVYIDRVRQALEQTAVAVGAQNCWHEPKGAFTGEVSASMLADMGCRYVIIGHSERRTLFAETDDTVNLKLRAALSCGLIPILCVGETLHEREQNETFAVIQRQMQSGLQGVEGVNGSTLVVAYEPVWAIGTGRAATSAQAQEVHAYIRSLLETLYGSAIAQSIAVLYGGSVTPDNAVELLSQSDVDGGLVGGASLKAESFLRIAEAAYNVLST